MRVEHWRDGELYEVIEVGRITLVDDEVRLITGLCHIELVTTDEIRLSRAELFQWLTT